MGGMRETLVDKEEDDTIDLRKHGSSTPINVGKIRVHESAGEVHFHDDENNKKCAVDAVSYWSFWDKAKRGDLQIPSVQTIIGKNGMAVKFTFRWVETAGIEQLDVSIAVVEQGASLKALDDFVVKA